MKYVYAALLAIIALAAGILAFHAIYGLLNSAPNDALARTSYENVVVVLLTTVTVIFTLFAVVLAVLTFVGPRALKREAGKYAEKAVLQAIENAMQPGGKAARIIEQKFPPNDGPTKDWIQDRIERQVIALLPLILDRMALSSGVGPVDPSSPEDEGDIV